jgi:sarcosine oxidase subunit alpha
MVDTTVSGLFDQGWIAAFTGNRLYKIRAKHVVLATGQFDCRRVSQQRPARHHVRLRRATADGALCRAPGRRAVVLAATRWAMGAALDLAEPGWTWRRSSIPREALAVPLRRG